MSPLSQIRQIDYTVIYVRDMAAMRHFYGAVMEFPLLRELSERWVEYRIGAMTLAPIGPIAWLRCSAASRRALVRIDALGSAGAQTTCSNLAASSSKPSGHAVITDDVDRGAHGERRDALP